MEIAEIDQEVSDFDWFAVDCGGYLVHFASMGNRLPDSVAASKENLDLLRSCFMSLPVIFSKATLLIAPTRAPFPFLEFAFRGLVSYEANVNDGPMGTIYELTARPPRLLTLVELPPGIAELVSKTQLGLSSSGLRFLDTEAVA